MTSKSQKLVLSRAKTLDFLQKLATDPSEIYQTIYLPLQEMSSEIEKAVKDISPPQDIVTELVQIIKSSVTGAIIFWGVRQKYLVIPPFPIIEKSAALSLDTAPLQSMLNKDYYIGIVLVRLGSYAIGFCHGEKLISSKMGTGLIHGRHRKGGSSAHRFERHRDKQIESFLIRLCGHLHKQFETRVEMMDYIVYGGARTTILTLQKYCPLLMKIDKPVLPPLLDIPEPRHVVLESAISRIWSSTIYIWTED